MIQSTVDPFNHQKTAVDKFSANNYRQALFWDVGCGKTLAALMCFRHAVNLEIVKQLLVLSPISLIENAWGEDIKKFTDFEYTNFHKSKTIDNDIALINLESFISKKKYDYIKDWIHKKPTMCVIDESSKIKNYRAKCTKSVLSLKKAFCASLVLSGTPAPNDESEYWPQMVFLSDDIFPTNFFAFRHRYFTLTRGGFTLNSKGLRKSELGSLLKKGFKYKLIPQKEKFFFSCMAKHVDRVKKEDVLDLPDQLDEVRSIILGTEQRKAYNQMKTRLITEIQGENVVATIALAKLTRLRQIISGFSKSDTGKIVELKENPKLKELKDLLAEIGKHQVMICAEYHKEIDDIKGLVGDNAVVLDGRTSDKDEAIQLFKDNKVQYLIFHPLSGGVGLSFNACDYMIFYSLSYSSENYIQSRGRIHRPNKKNNATYIHLIAENSIDEIIFKCLHEKRDKMAIIEEFLL